MASLIAGINTLATRIATEFKTLRGQVVRVDTAQSLTTGQQAQALANIGAVGPNTLTVLAPRATGSDQTAALNSAIASAATFGLWLALNGDHVISGQLTPVSGSKIDGTRGTLTQTGSLKSVFRIATGVNGVQIRDVKATGKTTDYTNGSGVYAAAGVYIEGTSSDIRVDNCRFLGMAGAGVYLSATASDVHVTGCKLTGPGPSYITSTTFNYSGGIVTQTGAANWSAHRNDISGFAQGIVTGDNMTDVRITSNRIHDIPGQHGIYCDSVDGAIITDNLIRNTGLLGMKIQVGATTVSDPSSIVIANNCFINVGAQAILLTNPVGGTPRLRRINVTGNVITTSAAKAIEANNCVGLHVADNIIYDAAQGISINNSSSFDLTDNRIHLCSQNGITITDCQDGLVDNNRITDPATANTGSLEFGVSVAGSTSADLTLRDNKVTDAAGNMKYGIFVSAGDLTTMDFVDNRVSGATDYGYRGLSANARTFRNNALSGVLGSILTPPLNLADLESASGASVAATVGDPATDFVSAFDTALS